MTCRVSPAVEGLGERTVVDRIAHLGRPVEEVYLFVVHEEGLVKEADLFKDLSMDQQGTTQQQLDRLDLVPAGSVRSPLSLIGAENMTPVQAAPGGVETRAILITQDLGSVDSGALLFRKLDQAAEPFGLNDDVIVQEIKVVRSLAFAATSLGSILAFTDRGVEGSGVAPILIEGQDRDLRGDESQRSVARGVVHHDYLE